MKKKLIALAIAAAVAAPLTAQAAATLSGDAEFTMGNSKATGWEGYNRVRVKVDADLGGGVAIHTRLRMTTGGDNEVSFADANAVADISSSNAVRTDYAYLTAKAGPVALTMGDQLATWGTKYFYQGAQKNNRLKAAVKVSDQFTGMLTMDPYAKADGTGAPGFALYGIYKVSNMMTAGIMLRGSKDDTAATEAANNVFVKGQVGGVVFGFESDSAKDNTGSRGNYMMVGMKAGGADLALHYADATGQDSDFEPLGIINGDATTSAVDAGLSGAQKLTLLTAGMKAGGMNVTVGAGRTEVAGTTESIVGLDLGKKLGAANFNFSYGTYAGDTGYGFSFKTKF